MTSLIPISPPWDPETGDFLDRPPGYAATVGAVLTPAGGAAAGPGPCLDPSLLPGVVSYWVGRQAHEGTDFILDEVGDYDLDLDYVGAAPVALGAAPWPESEQRLFGQLAISLTDDWVALAQDASCYVLVLLRVEESGRPFLDLRALLGWLFGPGLTYPGPGNLAVIWDSNGGADRESFAVDADVAPGELHLAYFSRTHGATSTATLGLDGVFLGSQAGMTNPDAGTTNGFAVTESAVVLTVATPFSELLFGSGAVLTEAEFAEQWALVQAALGSGTAAVLAPEHPTDVGDHASLTHLNWADSGHTDLRTAAQTAAGRRTLASFDHRGRARPMATIPASMLPASSPTFVPFLVPEGSTFTVTENSQALYCLPITNDGTMAVDGYLIEVN